MSKFEPNYKQMWFDLAGYVNKLYMMEQSASVEARLLLGKVQNKIKELENPELFKKLYGESEPMGWVEGPAVFQIMEPLTQDDIDKGIVRPRLDGYPFPCQCDMNHCPSYKEDGSFKYKQCEEIFGKEKEDAQV